MAILVVSPFGEDRELVRAALSSSGCTLCYADNCPSAWRILHDRRFDAVLTETEFPDALGWGDLLDEIASMRGGPPVIVMSRCADERLWIDVLERGGYDVLAKPLDETELFRVVQYAALAQSVRLQPNCGAPSHSDESTPIPARFAARLRERRTQSAAR